MAADEADTVNGYHAALRHLGSPQRQHPTAGTLYDWSGPLRQLVTYQQTYGRTRALGTDVADQVRRWRRCDPTAYGIPANIPPIVVPPRSRRPTNVQPCSA